MDFYLRLVSLVLLISIAIFWYVMAEKADKEKAKIESTSLRIQLQFYISLSLSCFILLQLGGLSIFPINNLPQWLQIVGFVVLSIGVFVAWNARLTLGNNWTHAQEYQIKKDHQLVTSGIYHYVRHPMYLCFLLFSIGAELVAKSWLLIPFITMYFVMAYYCGKREEKLLLSHFGKEYREYMKKSKMLIPFIF